MRHVPLFRRAVAGLSASVTTVDWRAVAAALIAGAAGAWLFSGAGVNPQAAAGAAQWPLSIAILAVAVFAIGASVYLYLHKFAG